MSEACTQVPHFRTSIEDELQNPHSLALATILLAAGILKGLFLSMLVFMEYVWMAAIGLFVLPS